jgi:predicted nucleic acid-binding protein
MGYLLDTNVLIRLARRNDPQRHEALVALRLLRSRNEDLYYTSQVLAEFWNVCTRPSSARGGLGLSIQETDRKSRIVEKYFTFLPDSAATHAEWRRLIVAHSVECVQVHDARIAASARVHRIGHVLTFNAVNFKRFSGIVALAPNQVT